MFAGEPGTSDALGFHGEWFLVESPTCRPRAAGPGGHCGALRLRRRRRCAARLDIFNSRSACRWADEPSACPSTYLPSWLPVPADCFRLPPHLAPQATHRRRPGKRWPLVASIARSWHEQLTIRRQILLNISPWRDFTFWFSILLRISVLTGLLSYGFRLIFFCLNKKLPTYHSKLRHAHFLVKTSEFHSKAFSEPVLKKKAP